MCDVFKSEKDFEKALIDQLVEYGWSGGVLHEPDEKQLIDNWAQILFENNKGVDRLNGVPLTDGEMQQLLEQIANLRTPMKINGFINGRTVSIKRDNPADKAHFGKEVSLYIYDRRDIAGGRSIYQIAEQPRFKAKVSRLNDRRGDVMLLINGMPLIHIELKASGIPVSQARNQIQKYSHEGVFTGLFNLVQIFVAMNPDETVYFANPGETGDFSQFIFHWGDFHNNRVNYWKDIVRYLLSIPMAHQLVGFYSVADASDGCLKVMRSYQYYAASRISDIVRTASWDRAGSRGGYVWNTTGSGKTMTSFKSAQLIAESQDADKVVFLLDRIELGDQALDDYRGFADDPQAIQKTASTYDLRSKLKSNDSEDTLIVTSIQKMSNIGEDDGYLAPEELDRIRAKRIVFIVDECHRSTFGEMMQQVRRTFPCGLLFGFTGTPIKEENAKKHSTTSDIFGSEICRYSLADGIRDKNVLPFDPYMVCTFNSKDMSKQVALAQAKAADESEAFSDETKKETYLHFMDAKQVPMAGTVLDNGKYLKGIEDYVPESQYSGTDGTGNLKHFEKVVEDILDNWRTLSLNGKYHAILATKSIPEAVTYYRMLKKRAPYLHITALFDPTIGNDNVDGPSGDLNKEKALVEILDDYSQMFPDRNYKIAEHASFKKDVSTRLAHKKPHRDIDQHPEERLDLLVVVNQMLTGYDSKYVNTLYLDKVLEHEAVIQAFSRTNRVLHNDKQFGTIRYYRRPYTMECNVAEAVREYAGNDSFDLFVDKLEKNIEHINEKYRDIADLFESEGVEDFTTLPESQAAKGKFAKLFKELSDFLDAAKIQGFDWEQTDYDFTHEDGTKTHIQAALSEKTYFVLHQRYIELFESNPSESVSEDVPYEIDTDLAERGTGRIDSDYMNEKFKSWLQKIELGEEAEDLLKQLHKEFASLSMERQKYAEVVIHEAQAGRLDVQDGKDFTDYINDYQQRGKNGQVISLVEATGVDRELLEKLMKEHVTTENIDAYGRYSELLESADTEKAKAFLEKRGGKKLESWRVSVKLDELLRGFILNGGFDIE